MEQLSRQYVISLLLAVRLLDHTAYIHVHCVIYTRVGMAD